MSESVHLIKLAYLIEISVVLNLTYREIKYSQTGAKLISALDKVMNDLRKKEIDIESEFYDPEYTYLVNIYEGNDKEAWQGHNLIRKFYRKFLKNGYSIHIVTACLLFNVFFLSVITLLDHINLPINIKNNIWTFGYIALNITIFIPLFFMCFSGICYKYLFGNSQDIGRVGSLQHKIFKKSKDWQKKKIKIVEKLNVLTDATNQLSKSQQPEENLPTE
jgi:hypothetical protein